MKALKLTALVMVLLFAVGASPARYPYRQDIEKERGSLDGVVIEITKAEEARILARGYDEWGIEGRQVYIEATAENKTEDRLPFSVTFYARDIFDKVLGSCEKLMRLEPGEVQPLKCMVQVNDARNVFNVTYKVEPVETRQSYP